MALEKDHQAEFGKILRQYGLVFKNQDLVVCPVCHSKVHPKNEGIPDYIYMNKSGLATYVECKGGETRFSFNQIEDHQREYATYLAKEIGRETWLLLVTGTEPVTSKTSFRRRMWLVPYYDVFATEQSIKEISGYGYIPIDNQTGNMKKYPELCMENLWATYELPRIVGNWEITPDHLFSLYARGIFD